MYILPEYFADIKEKGWEKMPWKTPKEKKLFQNKENNLSYACFSKYVNLLFETISDRTAFW